MNLLMQYNQRTAQLIGKWMLNFEVPFIFMRLLKAVLKAAWKDKTFELGGLLSQLQLVRQYRDECWW